MAPKAARPNKASGGAQKQSAGNDPVRLAYANSNISPRESSGRPGTPHRYFDSSHLVSIGTGGVGLSTGDEVLDTGCKAELSKEANSDSQVMFADQVVHRHVNGLCVVTAGETLKKICSSSSPSLSVSSVEFLKEECENQSVGGKKKKHKKAKFARNKHSPKRGDEEKGSANPGDSLAIVKLSDGRKFEFHCCVLGTILEVNRRLLEGTGGNLLVTDPLLDGFLCVILPTGPFPLPRRSIEM
uniref:Protein Abitram n=1 Tax=Odontella aurita TaxID=265563 RepID=A0A7S4KCT9_9STRA|mmetsp:Transcript_9689/g.28995  ORF Transcript_9689/g.28995 Transcript_9689/m.28995 type:complete len:242 (+) Transcript_9689:131-856(+)